MLSGAAVVDESSLTGESMPVRKRGVRGAAADKASGTAAWEARRHAQHTILAGTTVLQMSAEGGGGGGGGGGAGGGGAGGEEGRCAVVVATGVATSKGEMLMRIMFPAKVLFKYDEELPIAFVLLFLYAALLIIPLTTSLAYANGLTQTFTTVFVEALYSVTQVVNPLLPISLIAGRSVALGRLGRGGVACVEPQRIPICGKVKLVCFDKTGTLTEDGLDFVGLHLLAPPKPTSFFTGASSAAHWLPPLVPFDAAACPVLAKTALASCHAVSRLGERLVGLQLEVRAGRPVPCSAALPPVPCSAPRCPMLRPRCVAAPRLPCAPWLAPDH